MNQPDPIALVDQFGRWHVGRLRDKPASASANVGFHTSSQTGGLLEGILVPMTLYGGHRCISRCEHIVDVLGISFNDASETPGSAQDRSRVRKAQFAAKVAFIDKLLRDLDILVYCELSALYYMEYVSSPFDPTRNQPFVGAILASNLFCMIFHAFFIRPEAGEATRGYLHGGLFIDFIGQKPVPVFRLLTFDLLILLVDFLMLGLIIERVKTTATNLSTSTNSAPTQSSNSDTNTPNDETQQDHDAEERGVVRGPAETGTVEPSHEPSTSPPLAEIDDGLQEERTTLLAEPGDSSASRGRHPLDSFASGRAIILEMGLFTTIRDQWLYTTQSRRPSGYVPSPEAATLLRQRFGLQVGSDGRITRVNS
ncbi:hypothetical protein N7468_009190 [Penicillium chermesinum]|uniref:DUF1746 domain-containing protein n=1 Tax=Penicillium chermesinum TaxID=63820 RepID=A0A9W9NHM2_9EURO|nr:uncharacterized protein N7468_009190 [Penicillium chermesinum]KAJ5219986.1 hypothetical protein N7468_009190 [Penicillium chermesinum]